jgi:hypothetical protein
MKYVCDAPGGGAWFRIETEEEATAESSLMRHSMERHFRAEMEKARKSFRPPSSVFFEQEIGLKAHLQREMPMFLTLRDDGGVPRATAMLPQTRDPERQVRPLILGHANTDPYVKHADAIFALGKHLHLTLDRARCYPYPPGRH